MGDSGNDREGRIATGVGKRSSKTQSISQQYTVPKEFCGKVCGTVKKEREQDKQARNGSDGNHEKSWPSFVPYKSHARCPIQIQNPRARRFCWRCLRVYAHALHRFTGCCVAYIIDRLWADHERHQKTNTGRRTGPLTSKRPQSPNRHSTATRWDAWIYVIRMIRLALRR